MNKDIINQYRKNRKHQFDLANDDGGLITTYKLYLGKDIPSGKVDRSYGAAYGFHAVCAYDAARSSLHFRKTLTADIAATKKRSAAAKRGWKKRNG